MGRVLLHRPSQVCIYTAYETLCLQCARVCPNTVPILHYITRKLNAVPATRNWLAVRLSYGMNGIMLPTQYLPSLTRYLR